MPNWITNTLTIGCANAEKVMAELCNEKGHLDFSVAVPCPDDIYQGSLGKEEKEKYGKKNWYDWNIENWGTKWNIDTNEYTPEGNFVRFDTAWSHPHKYYLKVSKKYPKNTFKITWYDEDLSVNLGTATILNGQITEMNIPEDCSEEAYELLFRLYPESREYFIFKDGEYVYKE